MELREQQTERSTKPTPAWDSIQACCKQPARWRTAGEKKGGKALIGNTVEWQHAGTAEGGLALQPQELVRRHWPKNLERDRTRMKERRQK